MTVKEAFEKYEVIIIDYVFRVHCRECHKWYEEIDEEYSFSGDKGYFTGEWAREYGVLDLEDKIERLHDNHFVFYKEDPEEGLCSKCSE